MIKYDKIVSIFCLLLALNSCQKEQIEDVVIDKEILFGVEEIAQTKLAYGDQTNGGLSAKFSADDKIGVYAYYNNFYYYYTEYESFAESVVFSNQGMWITNNADGTQGLSYSPLRSWTFSTLYGTAPYKIDCIAFYPYNDSGGTSYYNPKYINMVNDESGKATLEYYYYGYMGNDADATYVVNSNIDFMTAHTLYQEEDATDFRSAMLGLDYIPLVFTRQTASLNLQVTKPDDYPTEIIVTGISVYFDAYTKFTQTLSSSGGTISDEIRWEDMTTDYSLTASTTCNATLAETGWNAVPDEDSSNEVEDLLEDDEILFFPPDTEIFKIVFTLTDDGEAKTYTWHPHIATIVANTHYTLSLELDPARAN